MSGSAIPALIIRDARPNEYPAIEALTLAAYNQYEQLAPPVHWRALRAAILNGLHTQIAAQRIVAELAGNLVGAVMLFPADAVSYGNSGRLAVPELRLLAVSSEHRGRGIGQRLIEECIRRARLANAVELGLHTSAVMASAVRMYERMGFYRYPADDFQPENVELITAYRFRLSPDNP